MYFTNKLHFITQGIHSLKLKQGKDIDIFLSGFLPFCNFRLPNGNFRKSGFLLEAGSQALAPVYYEQSFEKKKKYQPQ